MTLLILSLLLLLAVPTCGCGDGEGDELRDQADTTISEVVDSAPVTTTDDIATEEKDSAAVRTDSVSADTKGSDKSDAEEEGSTDRDEACGEITDARVRSGAVIFSGKGNCSMCHKGDGTGTPLGPDLTDDVWINISGDYSSIIENIRTGVPMPEQYPTPMPAMGGAKLTDEEVCAVAAYVWSLSR